MICVWLVPQQRWPPYFRRLALRFWTSIPQKAEHPACIIADHLLGNPCPNTHRQTRWPNIHSPSLPPPPVRVRDFCQWATERYTSVRRCNIFCPGLICNKSIWSHDLHNWPALERIHINPWLCVGRRVKNDVQYIFFSGNLRRNRRGIKIFKCALFLKWVNYRLFGLWQIEKDKVLLHPGLSTTAFYTDTCTWTGVSIRTS